MVAIGPNMENSNILTQKANLKSEKTTGTVYAITGLGFLGAPCVDKFIRTSKTPVAFSIASLVAGIGLLFAGINKYGKAANELKKLEK